MHSFFTCWYVLRRLWEHHMFIFRFGMKPGYWLLVQVVLWVLSGQSGVKQCSQNNSRRLGVKSLLLTGGPGIPGGPLGPSKPRGPCKHTRTHRRHANQDHSLTHTIVFNGNERKNIKKENLYIKYKYRMSYLKR